MQLVLPQGVTASTFDAALRDFAGVVGDDWVFATDVDRDAYLDLYTPNDTSRHVPSAAVAPHSVDEVQALVRLANEHGIPVWPVSRGKNYGYGGTAPLMNGTVVLDLNRMNRILDVDEKHGYCLLEPGVGFYDLYAYLRDNDIPLWMSVPGNAWGSVMGNALERGFGYTPYGDHSSKVCGLEVVLPDGELVRTGMGAMSGGRCWQMFRHGYGPSWDQMFMQSNFGIATKMGLWLMPEPESTLGLVMEAPEAEDIRWVIDELAPLRQNGVLAMSPNIGCFMQTAMVVSQRSEWYDGDGALPVEVENRIMETLGIGWWHVNLHLYGYEEVNERHARVIREAFARHTDLEFTETLWRRGDPIEQSGAGIPMTMPLNMVNWAGGRGGHLGFSPVVPPDGEAALAQFRRTRQRYREHGLDYYISYTMGDRHINTINEIIYNKDDEDMVDRARRLFTAMMEDARAVGYGEYRTHLTFMDDVAATFDYNNQALRRLNERVKDALDPNGILAPGKQGIWPQNRREPKG